MVDDSRLPNGMTQYQEAAPWVYQCDSCEANSLVECARCGSASCEECIVRQSEESVSAVFGKPSDQWPENYGLQLRDALARARIVANLCAACLAKAIELGECRQVIASMKVASGIQADIIRTFQGELGECRRKRDSERDLHMKEIVQLVGEHKRRLTAVLDIARSLPGLTEADLARLEEAAKK